MKVESITAGNTNNYGVYIGSPSGGSGENYSLFVAGGTSLFNGTIVAGNGVANVAAAGAIRLANLSAVSWRNSANSADCTLFVDSNNVLSVTNMNSQSTVGAAGGASALPATPVTYIRLKMDGTTRKIPVYND